MTQIKPSVEKSIDAEVLTILANNDSIVQAMDPTLKKNLKAKAKEFLVYGAFLTAAISVVGLPTKAHAMDDVLKGTLGAAALAGVLSNGTPARGMPADCQVKGANGWKVGGAGAVGAAVGNQIGGGNGKKVMTVLGGIFGGTVAANSENNRMIEECMRNTAYAPNRNMNNQQPQDSIYYQGVIMSTGQPYYVTARNSIGIAGLYGQTQTQYDISQVNPVIKHAMDETSTGLENSFRNLDMISQNINQRLTGTVETRYRLPNTEEGRYQESQNQIRLQYLKQEFDKAYVSYAEARAMFVHMADNAANDGVRITQYQQYLNYAEPPISAKIMFNGNLPNKYAILPNARIR